jgi:hypothetical protein
MGITITKPPVQASGIDMQDAMDMAAAIADLAPGEFVTNGQTFPSVVEERKNKEGKKVEVDKGRAQANATAHKFIRVIESRFHVTLRSRTWQTQEGEWTFGLCEKSDQSDQEEEGAPAQD